MRDVLRCLLSGIAAYAVGLFALAVFGAVLSGRGPIVILLGFSVGVFTILPLFLFAYSVTYGFVRLLGLDTPVPILLIGAVFGYSFGDMLDFVTEVHRAPALNMGAWIMSGLAGAGAAVWANDLL